MCEGDCVRVKGGECVKERVCRGLCEGERGRVCKGDCVYKQEGRLCTHQ